MAQLIHIIPVTQIVLIAVRPMTAVRVLYFDRPRAWNSLHLNNQNRRLLPKSHAKTYPQIRFWILKSCKCQQVMQQPYRKKEDRDYLFNA